MELIGGDQDLKDNPVPKLGVVLPWFMIHENCWHFERILSPWGCTYFWKKTRDLHDAVSYHVSKLRETRNCSEKVNDAVFGDAHGAKKNDQLVLLAWTEFKFSFKYFSLLAGHVRLHHLARNPGGIIFWVSCEDISKKQFWNHPRSRVFFFRASDIRDCEFQSFETLKARFLDLWQIEIWGLQGVGMTPWSVSQKSLVFYSLAQATARFAREDFRTVSHAIMMLACKWVVRFRRKWV